MEFRELTIEEFINFTEKYNSSIFQTPEYGFIMENQGYTPLLLGLLENNKIIAASLVLIIRENGFKYAYSPKGFILNYEDESIIKLFSENIIKYLSKKGVMGIKMNPMIIKNIYKKQNIIENPKYKDIYNTLLSNSYYHLGYNNFFESLKPRFEAVIDLTKSLDELFNNIKKEYKTKIRSSFKNGIKIYKGDINDISSLEPFSKRKYNFKGNYFHDCFEYFEKRNMVDLYYTKLDTKTYLKNIQDKLSYYELESDKLNEEIMKKFQNNPYHLINKKINIDKYVNQYKNDIIAATKFVRENPNEIITSSILVIKQKKEVTILIDSYDKRYKKLNSKHLLIWQLIEIYKKQGFEKFNLGGLSNISTKSKYTGLNDFKINFGADVYEYAGDFELITNKRNYELYRNFVPLKNLIKDKLIK